MTDLIKAIQRAVGVKDDGVPGSMTWNAIAIKLGVNTKVEFNPDNFFNSVRNITGKLDTTQVESINAMLDATKHWNTSWIAYALATAWHESRLRPIREAGGDKYLSKYDTGKLAQALGNTPEADGDGILYAGRGYVQLTGKDNYRKAGNHLGLDLLSNPDKALDITNAIKILVWGMEGGHFTGKSLKTYLPHKRGNVSEFSGARRIINGTDKAAMIADYAIKFQKALIDGGYP